MKIKLKRSRCVECGRYIRNHSFCRACVDSYRNWKAWIESQPFNLTSESAIYRRKRLAEMERECEQ
jgi:ribosomal protein L32